MDSFILTNDYSLYLVQNKAEGFVGLGQKMSCWRIYPPGFFSSGTRILSMDGFVRLHSYSRYSNVSHTNGTLPGP